NKVLNALFGSILEKADNICYEKVLPIFRKMPGIVQLLPTIDLVCPDGVTSNLTVNGNAIKTKGELLNYYQSCKWAHENEDMNAPVRSWVADLEEYWDAFYVNGVHATKLVNTHYFAGNDINTTKSATVIKEQGQYATSYETLSDKGDGTVLYVSATINETKNVYPTQGYSHTDLGQAFIQELCIPQTIEATKSIDNPYKIWWIKLGH
ncbi:MAG: hypothetical protein K5765_08815, partial [Clostridia bacterium]|nr:hypothetical protein [Clostridia bacterium]